MEGIVFERRFFDHPNIGRWISVKGTALRRVAQLELI
jgi:hypothetical protein